MTKVHIKNSLLLAVLAVAALAYSPGLHGPLIFDDIENLKPLNAWFNGQASWLRIVFDNTSGTFGRPVSMASFVLNGLLAGPSVWAFKLGNLIIHLVNGLLVFSLFTSLLNQGALTRHRLPSKQWIPLLGASLWMLHPLLASTVLYVVQRMAMLSALFILLTMLAYLQGRIALNNGRPLKAWLLLLIAAPACTLLATLSKENGILAPALCALLEWRVFAPPAGQRRAWGSRMVLVVGLILPALAAVALTIMEWHPIVGGYSNRPFTLWERLTTQGRVLWSYIASLLLPYGPRLGLYHDDYPISQSLVDPITTLIALLGWILIAATAWCLRRSVPGLALGLAVFLVGHSLESSILPLLIYFEHRNYLPAVGAIWALLSVGTAICNRIAPHTDNGRLIFSLGSVALVGVLAIATAARASIWQSESAILTQALRHHPNSRWLRLDLAQEAMRRTPPNHTEARRHIDALLVSAEPSTRRAAGVWQLLADCGAGLPASAISLELAFGGKMRTLEADMLLSFEALGSNIAKTPCTNLDQSSLANALVSMLDNATVSSDHFNARRLRFKSSQLFLAANDPDSALKEARLAYSGTKQDAPIGVFLAELEAVYGDRAYAAELVRQLSDQIPNDDKTGRMVLERVRNYLSQQGKPMPMNEP